MWQNLPCLFYSSPPGGTQQAMAYSLFPSSPFAVVPRGTLVLFPFSSLPVLGCCSRDVFPTAYTGPRGGMAAVSPGPSLFCCACTSHVWAARRWWFVVVEIGVV